MDARAQRNAKEKVLRRLAQHLHKAGFARTKPSFFTRSESLVVEFLHLHKYTFNASFRPHLGIRVMNDPHAAVNLNGPTSDAYASPNSPTGEQHDFTFDESQEAIDRCARNLAAFVAEYAEPWFASWRDPVSLADSKNSPLSSPARAALTRAIAGEVEAHYVAKTRELLNAL